MDYTENSVLKKSQIRPPSRIPSPGKALHEFSESESNVRSKPMSKLPPPSTKTSSSIRMVNEPEPKRKTLAERAGEPARSGILAPSASRPTIKGTSLVGARNTFASSTSSHGRSNSVRNASNNSFGSSVGYGSRPQTSFGARSANQTSFSQSTTARPQTSMASKRPASSMDDPDSDGGVGSDGKRKAWDVRGRLEDVEAMYSALKDTMSGTTLERNGLEESVAKFKTRVIELESVKSQLESKISSLQADLDLTRQRLISTEKSIDDDRRAYRNEVDDIVRERRNDMDTLRRDMTEENERLIREHHEKLREARFDMDKLRREMNEEMERMSRMHREEIQERERRNNAELEDERRLRLQEVQSVKSQIALEQQNLDMAVGNKDREIQNMRAQLEELQGNLDREQTLKTNLQKTLDDSMVTNASIRTEVQKLEAHVEFLKSDVKGQSDKFVDMEKLLEDAKESEQKAWEETEAIKAKLIKEETIRRSLFNQVQELKGNIRVMCRIRPIGSSEDVDGIAGISYPDSEKESKELVLQGPEEKSSLGKITRQNYPFEFDRVFTPASQNEEVFEEISQLVQSALDGYNVCIFCYGQTGAGKTYTMSSADGMIPRATHQIYDSAKKLEEKGWSYSMEGSFIEVYNEDIHDLLGNPKEFGKKKHEIKHDEGRKQTSVTGLTSVPLESPDTVENILKQAAANRSVSATKSNERSSRSHSVFILKLIGKNQVTGESSVGTLNLVDLAGSERLKSSGAEGAQMKETQNINKSLSCLGDVIGALGSGKEGAHIPYRNSKLTYLLQYSLGGNSKTLMFVMISPLEAHLKETITSLKFATKVHNTHIGTAKKSTKVRD